MRRPLVFALLWPLLLCQGVAIGQTISGFIPNLGQVTDQHGHPNPAVVYLLPSRVGLQVQLRQAGFSYDTYRRRPGGGVDFQRIDIDLIGANPHAALEAAAAAPDMLHYPSHKVVSVPRYGRVTYRNIYPHIDMEFVAGADEAVEYNFILHPGARLSDIQLRYRGAQTITALPTTLQLTLPQGGLLNERMPRSYWAGSGHDAPVVYALAAGPGHSYLLGFDGPNGPLQETLIIDPIPRLEWGSYVGGDDDDSFRDMGLGPDGYLYAVGSTRSISAIASSGAYQSILAGNTDVLVAQFDADGQRRWTTYYGGAADDLGQGLAFDALGQVFIGGTTASVAGVATPDAPQAVYAGGSTDAFVARFGADGILQWATYIGGPDDEFANALAADALGNVYIAGWTGSATGIATPGAHQQVFAGLADAFVVRYAPDGARVWGTYYGDVEFDFGLQLALSSTGQVLLSGWTSSAANIATPGAYQTTYAGGAADAFMVQLAAATGQRQWATYYGGSADEYGDALHVAPDGSIYLGGPCSSPDGIATAGAHQTGLLGAFDAFLVKFTATGARQWATYYGGNVDETAYGITTDADGGVYLTGFTCSFDGMATVNAHQQTYGGGDWDAYLAHFNDAGQRQWSSYYGGEATDQSFAIGVDLQKRVYLAGLTSSPTGISTSNAHQDSFGGGFSDAFLARFTPCDAPIAALAAANSPLCEGQALQLNGTGGQTYSWTGPGGFISNLQNPVLPTPLGGRYVLTAKSGQGCLDTASVEVTVLPAPAWDTTELRYCDNESVMLSAASGRPPLSYALGAGAFQPDAQFGLLAAGHYSAYVRDAAGCADTLAFVVAAAPAIDALTADTLHCNQPSGALVVSASGAGSLSYSIDGLIFGASPRIEGLSAGSYTVYVRNEAGCLSSAAAVMPSVPPVLISAADVDFVGCEAGASVVLTPRNGALPYAYSLDGGATFQSDSTFGGVTAGVLQAIIRDRFGCQAMLDVLVPSSGGVIGDGFTLEAVACQSGQNTLLVHASGASGNLMYALNGGQPQVSFVFLNVPPGPFIVVVTDAAGCQAEVRGEAPETAIPRIISTTTLPANCGQANGRISLQAGGGEGRLQYRLNNGPLQEKPEFEALAAGEYTLAVVDEQGCETAQTVALPAARCPVYVPNAFSPNDDGVNDRLRAFAPEGQGGEVAVFRIFDRWGALVYETTPLSLDAANQGWDGQFKGGPAAPGAYVYYLRVNFASGESLETSGTFTLVR